MRKILFLILIIIPITFSSCSKDEEMNKNTYTIKNLTGVDWYDVEVCIYEKNKDDSELLEIIKAKDTKMGETLNIQTDGYYFFISCKNGRGKLFMTDAKYLSKETSVYNSDILVNL